MQSFLLAEDVPTNNNTVITHVGTCGVCSSAQDLAVLLDTVDDFWSTMLPTCRHQEEEEDAITECFRNIGFTIECSKLFAMALKTESHLCATECNTTIQQPCSNHYNDDIPCRECWKLYIEDDFTFFAGRTLVTSNIIEPNNNKRSCSDYRPAMTLIPQPYNPCTQRQEEENNDDGDDVVMNNTTTSNTNNTMNDNDLVICFSSHSTVDVYDQGQTYMKDLRLGDLILTSEEGTYEPIYTFGHYDSLVVTTFLQILPIGLEISSNHLLYVKEKGFIPASNVRIGDVLILLNNNDYNMKDNNDNIVVITDIRRIERRGVYAPFTPSGKIIVNRVLASCYVTLQPNWDTLWIGGGSGNTRLKHHDLAHAFTVPLRLYYHYTNHYIQQQQQEEGISFWIQGSLYFFQWLLEVPPSPSLPPPSSLQLTIAKIYSWTKQVLLLIPIVFLFSCLIALEHIIIINNNSYDSMVLITTGIIGIIFYFKDVFATKKRGERIKKDPKTI